MQILQDSGRFRGILLILASLWTMRRFFRTPEKTWYVLGANGACIESNLPSGFLSAELIFGTFGKPFGCNSETGRPRDVSGNPECSTGSSSFRSKWKELRQCVDGAVGAWTESDFPPTLLSGTLGQGNMNYFSVDVLYNSLFRISILRVGRREIK